MLPRHARGFGCICNITLKKHLLCVSADDIIDQMMSVFWLLFSCLCKACYSRSGDTRGSFLAETGWGVDPLYFWSEDLCVCCFSFLHLSALGFYLFIFIFLMISPGIAASAVSSLNLHFTEFRKISLAWVKVKSASHMSLWLAWFFCIPCMSLIFSLKNHTSSIWHIWALSLSYASTDWSFHWWRIKKEGPTPVNLHGRGSLLVFCHPPLHL